MILACCLPDPGAPASLLAGPRLLAVRADPPEAKPDVAVTYEALVIDADGARAETSVRWAFCASPKPLTETNSVSSACLDDAGVRLIAGAGASVTATTPADVCALFGPDTPRGDFRPRDPDVTGGFYQPVRVEALGLVAFARERIMCNLPNAPVDAAIELQRRYRANANPTLTPLVARIDGALVALDQVPAGARVRFEIGWLEGDAQVYPMFDPGAQRVVDRREALRVAWFATAGKLASEVTGRSEIDLEMSTENAWDAPSTPGSTKLWLVLRDSRGGVDVIGYELHVSP
ncbi:MAG: hypothetical protein ACMG6S_30845 [Byssovorax sp.]